MTQAHVKPYRSLTGRQKGASCCESRMPNLNSPTGFSLSNAHRTQRFVDPSQVAALSPHGRSGADGRSLPRPEVWPARAGTLGESKAGPQHEMPDGPAARQLRVSPSAQIPDQGERCVRSRPVRIATVPSSPKQAQGNGRSADESARRPTAWDRRRVLRRRVVIRVESYVWSVTSTIVTAAIAGASAIGGGMIVAVSNYLISRAQARDAKAGGAGRQKAGLLHAGHPAVARSAARSPNERLRLARKKVSEIIALHQLKLRRKVRRAWRFRVSGWSAIPISSTIP